MIDFPAIKKMNKDIARAERRAILAAAMTGLAFAAMIVLAVMLSPGSAFNP